MLNKSPFTDELLTSGSPKMFTAEHVWDNAKPVILIYASCHGRTLMDYFRLRPDVLSSFNVIRLETSVMLPAILDGRDKDLHNRQSIKDVFGMADIVLTYNMGARHGSLGLESVGKHIRSDAKVITFVAPNFSCFCPFGYGYTSTMPVMNALDNEYSKETIWQNFLHGRLDCLFPLRWRLEVGRLIDKGMYHDVGLADFVIRNHRKVKLWTAPAHPTFIPMAYMGNEICGLLGLGKMPESDILQLDYMHGGMRGQPETDYEFNHFKFEYPMRHQNDAGGNNYYKTVLDHIYTSWQNGGFLQPGND